MGQYCSETWPTGGWSFTSHTDLTGDPCAGQTGTIAHAGMYSAAGENNVVERCTDGRVMLFFGSGNTPLTAAFNDASGHPGCTFAVSPWSFPVFQSPFALAPLPAGYAHVTGFDFARFPYIFVDLLHDFGVTGGLTQAFILDQSGQQRDGSPITSVASASNGQSITAGTLNVASTAGFPHSGTLGVATVANGRQIVAYTGATSTAFTGVTTKGTGTVATNGLVDLSWGFVDDHQGHDYLMADGAPIHAVADGVVDTARFRDVSLICPGHGDQGEIYIRHRFSGGKATYDEDYESYYAHLETINVTTGQIVHKGDVIGFSGHAGCTGGTPHLHLSVFRLSNTASALSYPLVVNTTFTSGSDQNSDLAYRQVIDPDGFTPPTSRSFDPWAWRGFDGSKSCFDSLRGWVPCDWGGLSVNLWTSGQEPPLTPAANPVTW
jgi:murein DD-endopeptidase MepM/ murein hydrolase activator NlpD